VLKYDAEGRLLSANLELKNPNSAEALEHLPPEQLVEDILARERRIIEIMHEIGGELAGTTEAAA
jgi:type I restriction enzyme M protein